MPIAAKRNLSHGELDPSLRVHVDSAAYQTGLKTFRNMTTKINGGARNRAGTKLVSECPSGASPKRLLEWDFGGGDSYAVEMGRQTIQFHRNQIPVREPGKVVTAITKANPGVLTLTAHGFTTNDLIYFDGETGMIELNQRSFKVLKASADTFKLLDYQGNLIDTSGYTTAAGNGTVSRTYIIGSPYVTADLAYLNYDQSFDVMKIASGNHTLQDLTRTGNTSWALTGSLFSPSISAPTGLATSSGAGGYTWAITAIKVNTGEESLAATITGTIPAPGTPITLTWTNQSDAALYNVYRKDANGVYGLLQVAAAQASPTFIDNGIGPDYTKNPPGIQGSILSFGFTLSKLAAGSFPVTALPGSGRAVAWSPTGNMVAVGGLGATYLRIYLYQGGVFTNITATAIAGADMPDGQVNALSWSSDGKYLAAATSGTDKAIIYQVFGQTLIKNASGYTQPTGNAFGVDWASGSDYVVFAHATSPYMTILRLIVPFFFQKVTNPTNLPTAQGNAVQVLGPYITLGIAVPYYVVVIGHNGAAGECLVLYSLPTLPAIGSQIPLRLTLTIPGFGLIGTENILSLSVPSKTDNPALLSVGHETAPTYVHSFLLTPTVTLFPVPSLTAILASVANTASPPDGQVNGITEIGGHVVLATSGTAKLKVYDRVANILVANTTAFTQMTDNATAVAFSPDGLFLAATQDTTSPYAAMYGNSIIHPAAVGFGQQRLRIGQTPDHPDYEYDSAQNAFTNFAIRPLATDKDGFQFRVDGGKLNRIMHLLYMQKMIQLTTSGAIILHGDANGTITSYAQNPRMASYNGSNHVRPAKVGDTFIYVGTTHDMVFDLKKDIQSPGGDFVVSDLSTPSKHLLKGKRIIAAAYQENPDSIVWFVLDDGTVLSMTYNPDEQIISWARHDMAGTFEDVCCVRESDGTDRVYFVVDIGSSTIPHRMVVALQDRDAIDLKDQFFVDCGVTYDGRKDPDLGGYLTLASGSPVTLTSSTGGFFVSTDVGRHMRLYHPTVEGAYTDVTITGFTDYTTVQVTVGTEYLGGLGFAVNASNWSWIVNSVKGVWHLEGLEVAVFADGGVVSSPNNPNLKKSDGTAADVITVASGTASLPYYYEVVHVGLPYVSDIQTLEIDTVNGESMVEKKKTVSRVTVKLMQTKGLWFSGEEPDDDTTNDMVYGDETKVDVVGGTPVELIDTEMEPSIPGISDLYGSIFIRQADPVPCEIIGIFPAISV